MQDCFNNLVGITRKAGCPCLDSSITAEYKSSRYGIFLDELDGGITLESITSVLDCEGALVEAFKWALESAKTQFKMDLLADIHMRYKTAVDPWSGVVGSRSFARTRMLSAPWAGLKLEVKPKIGAYFTISAISLFLDQTVQNLELKLIKLRTFPDGSSIEEELTTLVVESLANTEKINTLNEKITLPLFELDGSTAAYYLIYNRSELGFMPKDNSSRCNCGRSEQRLLQYVNPVGVSGDIASLESMESAMVSNGIILTGEAKCGVADVICDAMELSEAIDGITGYAIQFKAGEILVSKVLASSEINRYTTANREYLLGRVNKFRAEYHAKVRWIGENINLSGTDCFACDSEKGMHIGGIFS